MAWHDCFVNRRLCGARASEAFAIIRALERERWLPGAGSRGCKPKGGAQILGRLKGPGDRIGRWAG